MVHRSVKRFVPTQAMRKDDRSQFCFAVNEFSRNVSILSYRDPDLSVAPQDKSRKPANIKHGPKHFHHSIHSLFWIAKPVCIVSRLLPVHWVKDGSLKLFLCNFKVTNSYCEWGFAVRVAVNSKEVLSSAVDCEVDAMDPYGGSRQPY